MYNADRKTEPQFTQPTRQIFTMFVVMGLVGTGGWLAHLQIEEVIRSNIYLNGFIVGVFLIGVISCLVQVFSLIFSVSWIEGFALQRPGHEFSNPPRMLVSLATLLRSRGEQMQIGASSARSILDSMATRLDESREITRYIINLLIFLGLLGTFYGLATTVPAVVETIKSLAPKEGQSSVEVFDSLMTGLEKQLGGMGTAFSSSLLGLAGSLVVGLLDLFSGHGQARFYRELEEWLSTITRVGLSDNDGEFGPSEYFAGPSEFAFIRISESIEELHKTFIRAEEAQTETGENLIALTNSLKELTARLGDQNQAEVAQKAIQEQNRLLTRIAKGQEKLGDYVDAQKEEPLHGFLNFTLKNMNVQLLRINEEIAASRVETNQVLNQNTETLRKELARLGRKNQGNKPGSEN